MEGFSMSELKSHPCSSEHTQRVEAKTSGEIYGQIDELSNLPPEQYRKLYCKLQSQRWLSVAVVRKWLEKHQDDKFDSMEETVYVVAFINRLLEELEK